MSCSSAADAPVRDRRFRDESDGVPPSVTIKDYTYGGSAGYPNPKKGGQPARFPTSSRSSAAPLRLRCLLDVDLAAASS